MYFFFTYAVIFGNLKLTTILYLAFVVYLVFVIVYLVFGISDDLMVMVGIAGIVHMLYVVHMVHHGLSWSITPERMVGWWTVRFLLNRLGKGYSSDRNISRVGLKGLEQMAKNH